MKRFLILAVVVALLYIGAEVLIAAYVERRLAEAAAKQDPAARDVSAEVSFPLLPPLLTRSEIERVELHLEHIDVGDFFANRVSVLLEGVELDLSESIQREEPVVEAIDRVEATIAIGSVEVSKVLPQGFRFEFTQGSAKLLGPNFAAAVRFRVVGPTTIGFEPVAGGRLPRGVPSSWTLSEAPFISCLETISVRGGLLVLTCALEDPPAQYPPQMKSG